MIRCINCGNDVNLSPLCPYCHTNPIKPGSEPYPQQPEIPGSALAFVALLGGMAALPFAPIVGGALLVGVGAWIFSPRR